MIGYVRKWKIIHNIERMVCYRNGPAYKNDMVV